MIDPWMINIGTLLVAGGTAYGGAKAALNGTRERVKDVKRELETLQEGFVKHTVQDDLVQRETVDRLARIETKLDILMRND